MKKLISVVIICTLCISKIFSQDVEPLHLNNSGLESIRSEGFALDYAKVTGGGLISNDSELPFWMHRNTNGRIDPQTNVFGLIQAGASYNFSKQSYIEVGAGVLASDGNAENIHRDEMYISFTNSWLRAILGSKTPFKKYQGLSSVARDFLISGNARALPGLLLEAPQPLNLSERFAIDWGIAHYTLNDTRYVDDTRIHYKRLGLVYNFNSRSSFRAGIEHHAQWAGTSPEFGEQPDGFEDFIDVFFAKGGGENAPVGDVLNSLGNHLGIYNFEYNFTPSTGRFSFYHQHPFEDGSGSAFKNFPDGIWGFYYGPNTKNYTTFITGLIIEYIQTTDQSGSIGEIGGGGDYYFSNAIYRSGWAYHGNTIGLPFITPQDDSRLEFSNNRVRGIHFGLSTMHKNISFKFKTSLVENLGTFAFPFNPKEKAIYSSLVSTYSLHKIGALSLQLGYDYSDQIKDKFGAGLSYSYSF